jgi:hypothetical protein
MSAPETIWLDSGFQPWRVWIIKMELPQYRRADLPPTDAQIMAHPSVAALVDALEKIRDGDALPTPSTGGMPPGQYAFIRRAGPWAQIAIAALAAMPGVQE